MASAPSLSSSASGSSPSDISPILLPIIGLLSSSLTFATHVWHSIPGSAILGRYVQSSYQNDPWRSVLEVMLVAFALRTLLMGRTRGEGEGKSLKLSDKVR